MSERLTSAISTLPPALSQALALDLADPSFAGYLSAARVGELQQLAGLDEDQLCFAMLPLAAAYALTPVSHFKVGAIARGISGNLYFGANMEFTGAPLQQTVHAEQSAINHAWLRGEKRLRGITVNYTPCGHCRQFMNELNSGTDLTIWLPERPAATLAHYLPDAFGPRDLSIQSLLLDEIDHHFSLAGYAGSAGLVAGQDATFSQPQAGDPLVQQALAAASRSHAPYSQGYCAVALQAADGNIYAGRYAENAAFNPSLPPLQSALILMNMSGADCQSIRRAVLVEHRNAPFSQWDATRATLQALGCPEIHRYDLVR